MKKVLSVFLILVTVFSLLRYALIANATASVEETIFSTATIGDDFADNRIMVVLSEEASKRRTAYSAVDFSEIGAVKAENLTAEMYDYLVQKQETGSQYDKERVENFKHVLCIELAKSGKENVIAAIKTLQSREDIIYAGPDFVVSKSATPEDPEIDQQWAISNINLNSAWNITTGLPTIRVGVLDTGIASMHEDLCDAYDQYYSVDFTGVGTEGYDYDGHGTRVAGIIGASGDNDTGVCGVCWNVKLVSIQVLDNEGSGFSSTVARGITYAAQNNIPIINLSLAWSGNLIANHYDVALNTIIASYPGLVVCAAGNDEANNDNVTNYPSNYTLSNIIVVGASTQNNEKMSASNYGATSVDVFAPGENIYTTIPTSDYAADHGTSFAAPFVSGIAALILSLHPNLSGAQLRDIIIHSVDVSTAFTGKCVSNGKVNAYKAVTSDLLHTYSTSQCSTSGHSCTHSSCDYVAPHDYDTISRYNTQKHKLTCSYCGHCIYELHQWNSMRTKCLKCGFNPEGSVVLGTGGSIFSSRLHLLE